MLLNNSKILAAFLWPLGSLISALKNWRQPWAMNIFWIVCIYMGAIQIFLPDGALLGDGADGGRYVMRLIEMHDDSKSLLEQIAYNFVYNGSMDYYQLIMTWLVSRITDNGHILFTCFALVFGYFYSRNIWYVMNRLDNVAGKTMFAFVALFFLACPIWKINGVRMWTATHILVYSILPYVMEGEKRNLKWLIAVPFVHFSFLYITVLSLIYVSLPNRFISGNIILKNVILTVFVLSMVMSSLNIDALATYLEQISPESYEERIELYSADYVLDNAKERISNVNWYVRTSGDICFWAINILLLLCVIGKQRNNEKDYMLYYCLIISALANVASQIPSGGRFITVAHLFSLAYILWRLSIFDDSLFRKVANIAFYPLLITIVFSIREGMDYYGISLVFGNFFTTIFWDNNVPIINFIK